MKIVDAFDLLSTPPKPINYLVEGLIPIGTCGDLFGPPGEGKSSLTLDLLKAVASGKGQWHGLKCVSGNVVILGGERSDVDSFQRDLHRSNKHQIEPGVMVMPQANGGEAAIWNWNKGACEWELTEWGKEVTDWLAIFHPVLVVLDTTLSVARGSDQLNNPQQYAQGETTRGWARKLSTTAISVSHTNQASAQQSVDWRLNYLSRAGGNGLPGSLRWMAGLSRLRYDDALAEKLELKDRAGKDWLICVGASKNNEMPRPCWTNDFPAIFQLKLDGSLLLVMDGREVKERVLNSTGTKLKKVSGGKSKKEGQYGNW